jgi:phosphomannomutase
VLGPKGWRILRGDEIGWLLASTLLSDADPSRDVVATSIVSSTMLKKMADAHQVRFAETLTGFKWISRSAGDGVLRFGYEEALGFAVDPLVADKDGLSAGLALCHLAHRLAQQGQTLLDRLDEIESQYGVHAVSQLSFRVEGPEAMSIIGASVNRMKASPPTTLGGLHVSDVADLEAGWHGLMPTEGMVLQLGTHGRVVVRPSGTEPKLKAYVEILGDASSEWSLQEQRDAAQERLMDVGDELTELLTF